MKIIEKIAKKQSDLNNSPVTVAFIGDSVTQGCFECYKTGERSLDTVFDSESAYSTRLKQMLNLLYPSVQINIVNSGISGDNIVNGAKRLQRDVLDYKPDLVVVSFGLNDTGSGKDGINQYVDSLKTIFTQLQTVGAEVIFLTQNTMCTNVSCHLTDPFFVELANDFAKRQNGGLLKEYFDNAVSVCKQMNVPVCDTYSIWDKMASCGVNTTELLANKLNHPIRQMHYYIAVKLLETMFN